MKIAMLTAVITVLNAGAAFAQGNSAQTAAGQTGNNSAYLGGGVAGSAPSDGVSPSIARSPATANNIVPGQSYLGPLPPDATQPPKDVTRTDDTGASAESGMGSPGRTSIGGSLGESAGGR